MSGPASCRPAVSALIDNFNYARYLGAAIESVLAQSYPVREIVICDDGSTDDSCEVAERYRARHPSVKLVRKENGGQASAFNAAFAASTGEIVCLLDSDDVWRPEKVARVVEAFSSSPESGWVRHKLGLADQALRPLRIVAPSYRGSRLPSDRYAHLEKIFTFLTTAVAFRRELAERLFPIPDSHFKQGPDLYLDYMCGVLGARGCSLDEELGLYRRHAGQLSKSADDFLAVVEAQIGMTRAFLAVEPCGGYVPTHVYKHEMIAAFLRCGRRFDPLRWRLCAAGLASVGVLAGSGRMRLALLQMAKLAYGFLLPETWIRRQLRLNAWDAT